MKRKFTKYPSNYVRASLKSWGKISTNPKVAELIVDISRFLKNHPDVENVDAMNNGDLQFIVDGYTYYLKIYKR